MTYRSKHEYPVLGSVNGWRVFYRWQVTQGGIIVSHGGVYHGLARFKKSGGWFPDRGHPQPSPEDIAALAAEFPGGPAELKKGAERA